MSQLDQILARGQQERQSLSRLFMAFALVILLLMLAAIGSISIISRVVNDYTAYRDISQLQMALDEVRIAEMILMRDHKGHDLPLVEDELQEFQQEVERVLERYPDMQGLEPLYRDYRQSVIKLLETTPKFIVMHNQIREQYFRIKEQIISFPVVGIQDNENAGTVDPAHLQHALTKLISALSDATNNSQRRPVDARQREFTQSHMANYLSQLDQATQRLMAMESQLNRAELHNLLQCVERYKVAVVQVGSQKMDYNDLSTTVVNRAQALSDTMNSALANHRRTLQQSYDLVHLLVLMALMFTLATFILVFTLLRSRRASLRVLDDLSLAVHEAQQAADAKARFLANMSHEIRNPMNAIIGLSQLALKEPLPAKVTNWLQRVQQSGQGLLRLLDDILDVSKVEAGKLVLESNPFDLHTVLEHIDAMTAFSARDKRLDWRIDVGADVPAALVGDRWRLGQVLLNLASNAVKFTQRGEVRLSVRVHSRQESSVELEFRVEDTGVGITPEHLETLFQPFDQGDPATTRRFGGTGLGLTICHGIASAMNALLTVHSQPGVGSRFALRAHFPLAELDTRPPHYRITALSGVRIKWHNGLQARPADWRSWTAYHGIVLPCDCAFEEGDISDPHLLVVVGDEPVPETTLPVLRLCPQWGGAVNTIEENTLALPLTSTRLARAISRILQPELEREVPHKHGPGLSGLPAGKRVLVVEDNAINRELMLGLLAPLQWQLDLVENGLEAVEQVKRRDYDLILMDCHMPVMDGFDAVRHIKSEGHCSAPIIALSAYVLPEEKARMWQSGFDDAVDKPIQIEQLQQALSRWLGNSVVVPEPARKELKLCQIDGIDLELALQNAGGQRPILHKALALFADQLTEFAGQKWAEETQFQKALHNLKGVAGNLGANALYWLCHQAEQSNDDTLRNLLRQQARKLAKGIRRKLAFQAEPSTQEVNTSRTEFVDALRLGDTQALIWVGGMTPASLNLTDEQHHALIKALDGFDFDQALAIVENNNND
ncbi:hybrid sensor histidine kinase/response regulator [Ferrimonas balearica]|uniref:hybrid sensor histidine kinase/response regulator n=1 Tax=Ferrimonas balearica TaxID=44012 RepID=UPI001C94CD02|nr:ATP-binding protein [Ferrimonas balearica]MBY5979308.1 response regulator [Ferrimonas balearica]